MVRGLKPVPDKTQLSGVRPKKFGVSAAVLIDARSNCPRNAGVGINQERTVAFWTYVQAS